jgi:hypothetical protein
MEQPTVIELLNLTMGQEYFKETTLFYVGRIGFNPHSTTAETARIAISLSFPFPPLQTCTAQPRAGIF